MVYLGFQKINEENYKKIEFPTLRNSVANNSNLKNDQKRLRDSLSRASISENIFPLNEIEEQTHKIDNSNGIGLNSHDTSLTKRNSIKEKIPVDNDSVIKNPFPDKGKNNEELIPEENIIPKELNEKEKEIIIKPESNSEDKVFIELYNNKFKEFKQFTQRDWKIWEDKNEYRIYYIDEKSGLRSIKSEIIVKKPLKTIFDFLTILDNKANYDKNYDSGYIIRNIEDTYSLQYHKYKGKLGVSPRDMTVIVKKIFDSESESSILATSFESEKFPRINKIERAELNYGGFILKKIDENNTQLIFYSCTDLKLAQWMVNMTLKEVAMCVINIRDLVSK